ncbi:hypothetical protein H6G52_05955 [Limnothrix sp. FACHB-881]|uniref:DUF6825 family protein n=1 Tax=Limnothrix sp. FACHB-881 TaxID=2692819 RepID=UPI0016867FBA|nr:hypothetical protein [Limnothrix sp. FACHB-881]MBD2634899.1 hypothetical protein [Limnothrix sp. FACHB-881]
MSNPLVHAFFVGRAIAEVVNEQIERTATDWLSELGKFDAEQRENLRQLVEEALARAQQAEAAATNGRTSSSRASGGDDVQAELDDLRAEIARLRSEIKQYRSEANPS